MAIRITQLPVETSVAATDGAIRVTQITSEASVAATDGAIRVTQLAVETSVLVTPFAPYIYPPDPIPQDLLRGGYKLQLDVGNDFVPSVLTKKRPQVFVVT